MAIECVEQQEWIEEKVSKPIEEWVEKQEEKCKKRPWWDPRRWLCTIVTTFVKVVRWVIVNVGKWVVRTVCKVVGTTITAIRDILTGVWDIFYSIYKGDWWGILHALLKIVATALHWLLTMVRIITFLDTVDYIVEEINHNKLKEYVRIQLQNKYGGQELQNIKDTLHLNHGAFGYRIPMRAIRTYLDSETPSPSTEPDEVGLPNLVVLNKHGIES